MKAIKVRVMYVRKPGKVVKNAYVAWRNGVLKGISKKTPKDAEIVEERRNILLLLLL